MALQNGTDSHLDPLREQYRETITATAPAMESMATHRTALLVVDMQYLDAARGCGVFSDLTKEQVPPEAQEYYFNRLEHVVIPNIRRLQDTFRRSGLEVIHTRIVSLTQDGRDRSAGHKRLGLHAAPGSKEADFLPEVAPVGDEVVVNKTASGVFTSTNMAFVLKNMGITGLFVCGVYTNECVDTTVRDASDLGFFTTLLDDACATVTPELHQSTLTVLRDRYARVLTTEQAVQEAEQFAGSAQAQRL